MTVAFRPGVPADAQAVAEVNVAAWRAAFRGAISDAFLDALTPGSRTAAFRAVLAGESVPPAQTTVAEQNGRVVGFVIWGASRDEDAAGDTGEICAIYVREELWGMGVGRALLDEAIAGLARAGFRRATLWTLGEVHRTLRFYAAAGFAADGAVKAIERDGSRIAHVRLAIALVGARAAEAVTP